jgi:predicted type IV restriction endonuclease
MKELIKEIIRNLKDGLYVNEASVSQGIVQPVLQALGWNIFNPGIVSPEYSIEGMRVDFALCHPPTKPIVFIEVKQIGKINEGEKQLFQYAFHQGVPMAILTDGTEWQFFLPAEQGSYDERRVYKLDLLERETNEIVERFNRYLNYTYIIDGTALENARKDYKNVAKKRIINQTLPKAIKKLIEEDDEILIELIENTVESLCGYIPEDSVVANFLKENIIIKEDANYSHNTPAQKKVASQANSSNPSNKKIAGFMLHGKKHYTGTVKEFCIASIKEISKLSPDFFEKYAAYPKHGQRRRFIAKSKYDLYPGRKDLAESDSYEIAPGWWLGTNIGSTQAEKIVRLGCKIANIKWEKEFKVLYK